MYKKKYSMPSSEMEFIVAGANATAFNGVEMQAAVDRGNQGIITITEELGQNEQTYKGYATNLAQALQGINAGISVSEEQNKEIIRMFSNLKTLFKGDYANLNKGIEKKLNLDDVNFAELSDDVKKEKIAAEKEKILEFLTEGEQRYQNILKEYTSKGISFSPIEAEKIDNLNAEIYESKVTDKDIKDISNKKYDDFKADFETAQNDYTLDEYEKLLDSIKSTFNNSKIYRDIIKDIKDLNASLKSAVNDNQLREISGKIDKTVGDIAQYLEHTEKDKVTGRGLNTREIKIEAVKGLNKYLSAVKSKINAAVEVSKETEMDMKIREAAAGKSSISEDWEIIENEQKVEAAPKPEEAPKKEEVKVEEPNPEEQKKEEVKVEEPKPEEAQKSEEIKEAPEQLKPEEPKKEEVKVEEEPELEEEPKKYTKPEPIKFTAPVFGNAPKSLDSELGERMGKSNTIIKDIHQKQHQIDNTNSYTKYISGAKKYIADFAKNIIDGKYDELKGKSMLSASSMKPEKSSMADVKKAYASAIAIYFDNKGIKNPITNMIANGEYDKAEACIAGSELFTKKVGYNTWGDVIDVISDEESFNELGGTFNDALESDMAKINQKNEPAKENVNEHTMEQKSVDANLQIPQ